MPKRKRNDLSVSEKKEVLLQYVKLPKMSQREAAAALKIANFAVYLIEVT